VLLGSFAVFPPAGVAAEVVDVVEVDDAVLVVPPEVVDVVVDVDVDAVDVLLDSEQLDRSAKQTIDTVAGARYSFIYSSIY
jgi:hypothetical protein